MTLPRQVGVYGGGRMGAGIAHAFLVAGTEVVVIEADAPGVDTARDRVLRSLAQADARGTLPEPLAAYQERVEVTTHASALSSCPLVIEAVPEVAALKDEVLRRIEGAAPEAVLATNTSSLS